MLPTIILTILLIPLFWVLIVLPQQRRQKAHAALADSLVAGDHVESFSGIQGTLVEVQPTTVRIEIAPGVIVTMARLAVASRIDDPADDQTHEPAAPVPLADEQDGPVDQQTPHAEGMAS